MASETAGFFDVFREGFWRLLAWPSTGRLVPLHVLIIPTVAHGVLSYLIYTGIKSVSLSTIKRVRESKERKQVNAKKTTFGYINISQSGILTSIFFFREHYQKTPACPITQKQLLHLLDIWLQIFYYFL